MLRSFENQLLILISMEELSIFENLVAIVHGELFKKLGYNAHYDLCMFFVPPIFFFSS